MSPIIVAEWDNNSTPWWKAIGMGEAGDVLEVACYRKDGVSIDIDFEMAPVQETQGNRSGVMSIVTDLTQHESDPR